MAVSDIRATRNHLRTVMPTGRCSDSRDATAHRHGGASLDQPYQPIAAMAGRRRRTEGAPIDVQQQSRSARAWYRSLNATQWKTLIAANLGWTFDGFEFFALFLTVGFALHQLLDAVQYTAIPRYAGYIVAATAFGWAIGGVIGGIIADYIGRKRTMILAIFAYSLTTGLSAIAWNWQSLAVLRFLVGVGIGSEWVTGASIVSELWPDHSRGKGGGLMQCCAGLGAIQRLRRVVGDRRYRAQGVALDVPGRCAAGAGDPWIRRGIQNRRSGSGRTSVAAKPATSSARVPRFPAIARP